MKELETQYKKPVISAHDYANLEKALVAAKQENTTLKEKVKVLEQNLEKLREELKGTQRAYLNTEVLNTAQSQT